MTGVEKIQIYPTSPGLVLQQNALARKHELLARLTFNKAWTSPELGKILRLHLYIYIYTQNNNGTKHQWDRQTIARTRKQIAAELCSFSCVLYEVYDCKFWSCRFLLHHSSFYICSTVRIKIIQKNLRYKKIPADGYQNISLDYNQTHCCFTNLDKMVNVLHDIACKCSLFYGLTRSCHDFIMYLVVYAYCMVAFESDRIATDVFSLTDYHAMKVRYVMDHSQ
jgi:hypothetical protein